MEEVEEERRSRKEGWRLEAEIDDRVSVRRSLFPGKACTVPQASGYPDGKDI